MAKPSRKVPTLKPPIRPKIAGKRVPAMTKDDQMRSMMKKAKGADRSKAIEDTYGDLPIV